MTVTEIMAEHRDLDEAARILGNEYDRLWAELGSGAAVHDALGLMAGEAFEIAFGDSYLGAQRVLDARFQSEQVRRHGPFRRFCRYGEQ